MRGNSNFKRDVKFRHVILVNDTYLRIILVSGNRSVGYSDKERNFCFLEQHLRSMTPFFFDHYSFPLI